MPDAIERTPTESAHSEGERRPLLAWLPLALLAAGAVAGLRLLGRLAATGRELPDASAGETALLAWERGRDLLSDLVPALVLALIATSLVSQAARSEQAAREERPPAARAPLFLFSVLVLFSGISGWPLATRALRAGPHAAFAADDLATCAAAAATIAVLLYLGARAEQRAASLRELFSGRLGLALALTALVAPLAWLWSSSREAPRFVQRDAAADLLTSLDNFEVLEQNPAAPARIGVLTPDTQNKTDSADKLSLILPPPGRVRFRVPEDGPFVLRAEAGLDKPIRAWLQGHQRARCSLDFLVRVDGEPKFEARIPSLASWNYDEMEAGAFVWHHIGSADGLRLESGSIVELETRIPPGDPAEAMPPEVLTAGFGTLVLERRRSIARTVARADRPNLILIVMDTLRADRMSCYGYERPTTPNLDALAERGLLFEHAISAASWTWPATASLLTGLPADEHGVISNDSCTLALDLQTVAEPLQLRGFTTAAFSCNPLIAADRNFDQGFELFDHDQNHFRMSDEVMPSVLRWLRGYRGARFFLYLHLADPHTPHRPHPEELARLGGEMPADFPDEHGMDPYAGRLNALAKRPGVTPAELHALVPESHRRWIQQRYDASVATGDRWLGELFRELERLGLEQDTVIAFTSDHGEELFDHDLLEHGHTIHAELVDVPLILAGPGIPRGLRDERVVSTRHLAGTLARLGGATLPGAERAGFEFLLDAGGSGEAVFQTARGLWQGADQQKLFGLRQGPWVLHWREDAQDDLGDVRLYNAEVDPHETSDVSRQELAQVKQMHELLSAEIERERTAAPEHRVGAGESGMELLMNLGYAQGGEEEEAPETGSGARGGAGEGEDQSKRQE